MKQILTGEKDCDGKVVLVVQLLSLFVSSDCWTTLMNSEEDEDVDSIGGTFCDCCGCCCCGMYAEYDIPMEFRKVDKDTTTATASSKNNRGVLLLLPITTPALILLVNFRTKRHEWVEKSINLKCSGRPSHGNDGGWRYGLVVVGVVVRCEL
jgi:hypothetical protein